MPGLRDRAHQADADGADQHAAAQHQPRAGAVGEPAGGEHGDGRHHLIERDGEAELAAGPAEIIDHRLQRQADGEAGAAADEQHEEAGGEDERAAGEEAFSRPGHAPAALAVRRIRKGAARCRPSG
ncbi:MAG: hypothetical protein P8Y71_30245 [Pseudolabrys sp.]